MPVLFVRIMYMEYQKKKFPYWIHIVLGVVWIAIGIALHSDFELAIWVAGGLVMLIIGFLNKR